MDAEGLPPTARHDPGSTEEGVGLRGRCPYCGDPIEVAPDSAALSVGWKDGRVDRLVTNDGAFVDWLPTTVSPKCILPTGDRYIGL